MGINVVTSVALTIINSPSYLILEPFCWIADVHWWPIMIVCCRFLDRVIPDMLAPTNGKHHGTSSIRRWTLLFVVITAIKSGAYHRLGLYKVLSLTIISILQTVWQVFIALLLSKAIFFLLHNIQAHSDLIQVKLSLQVTWPVVTEVRSESFGLVTERRH